MPPCHVDLKILASAHALSTSDIELRSSVRPSAYVAAVFDCYALSGTWRFRPRYIQV